MIFFEWTPIIFGHEWGFGATLDWTTATNLVFQVGVWFWLAYTAIIKWYLQNIKNWIKGLDFDSQKPTTCPKFASYCIVYMWIALEAEAAYRFNWHDCCPGNKGDILELGTAFAVAYAGWRWKR